ncbi:glycerophosphoryl diester phosphodiesterase [Spirosomataceae bacterium TFI 002]|nr:glycerophosphoryl diester phosphodiesterase [Spirosomataceae bacterium TFI 002]
MKLFRFSLILLSILWIASSCKTTSKLVKNDKQASIIEYLKYNNEWNGPRISVHRGGGEIENYPENCIESFQHVSKSFPVLVECDVEITKDNVLLMMHDASLDRTTSGSGQILSKTWNEIKDEKLKDNFGNQTDFKIPLLSETLNWARCKVILTLDLKKNTPFASVISEVEKQKSENDVVIITYNANQAKEVYELNPNLMISVGIMTMADYERLNKLGIPDKNMIAFIGTREPKKELIDFLHSKGILTLLGTLGNLDKKALNSSNNLYQQWSQMGVDIFATDYPFEVYEALR